MGCWTGGCVWGSEMEGWRLGRVCAALRSLFCCFDNGERCDEWAMRYLGSHISLPRRNHGLFPSRCRICLRVLLYYFIHERAWLVFHLAKMHGFKQWQFIDERIILIDETSRSCKNINTAKIAFSEWMVISISIYG